MASMTLFSGGGTLYQLAGESSNRPYYDPLGDENNFTISIVKRKKESTGATEYVIVVAEEEEKVLEQPIGVELQLSYSVEGTSVHWQALIEDELETVAFRFSAQAGHAAKVTPLMSMQRFVTVFNQCTYSLCTGYDSVEEDDEWYQYLGGVASHEIRNEDASEPTFEFDESKMVVAGTGAGNVCAAESLRFDRMLIIKKGNEAASLELQALPVTERGFNRAGAENITVSTVDGTATDSILENGDLSLLLFGGKKAAVQQVDLARGSVVQEYKPQELDIQTVSYSHHTSADSGSVYTCLGRNVAFNIDVRMDPRRCVVMEDDKMPTDYALSSVKDFTCHATSRNGYLVIGDSGGSIRLYTGPPGSRKPMGGYFPKAAKTLLETKTPIVDVDVTADGKYIVATTSKFLLFIETKYVDIDGKETNGFQSRMGEKKPQPTMLLPSPTQIMQMGGADALRFRSAKFDRFPGTEELCVTASCDSFVLTWQLRNILASKENGRTVVNTAVTVGQTVLSTSANRTEHVGFLTEQDVGVVPFHETKKVSQGWTWGQCS
jgi:hypothetical protein